MDYRNIVQDGDNYRKNYLDGIKKFISIKNDIGYSVRENFMPANEFPRKIEEYRKCYIDMLGIDKISSENCPPPEMIFAGEDELSKFYRVVVYITPEIPFHGLLMVPHNIKKAPLVIAQHGGGGTPELCSDMNGDNNYNHMSKRLLKRGLVTFAPQLLLWNVDQDNEKIPKHNLPYNRHEFDKQLKRFGLSITALEIKGITESITYLSSLDFVDENNIGMMGLSYGGYFTLHTMAADIRIKSGYSNAAFNDRNTYSWFDWCYKNSGNTFHDAEVAALCAPRKLYVSVGTKDEVFTHTTAVKEAQRVHKYFDAFLCPQNFVFNVWEGGHTVNPTDEGIDFLLSSFN